MGDEDDQQCNVNEYVLAANGSADVCGYVGEHSDACDGGGYILWTELFFCTDSPLLRLLIGVAAVLFFALLFVHLSTTADSFFCKNIAAIVDIHRISQNIAGITFMAFGNGAPDIFGSIASVISTKQPRADLAISELLGGGIFVTTCVIAAIAFSRPFLLMRRPVLRDIFFYLLALALLIVVATRGGKMHLWQPLAFLLLYATYAGVVVSTNLFRQRLRVAERRTQFRKTISRFSGLVPPKRSKVCPLPGEGFRTVDPRAAADADLRRPSRFIVTPSVRVERNNGPGCVTSIIALPSGSLVVPIDQTTATARRFSARDFLDSGKFFAKEELDADDGEEQVPEKEQSGISTPSSTPPPSTSEQRQLLADELYRFLDHVKPIDGIKWRNARGQVRVWMCFKTVSLLLLNCSVPCASKSWSKLTAMLHAFLAPIVFCFAFGLFWTPLTGSLIVGEIALALSLLFVVLLLLFTSLEKEPICYRRIAAYTGFWLSFAWIYATAAEVMNVVLMFGNLSGIPYPVLGLTAIAWSNSIGDLIADVSVARQGLSRMAFSAAIGAPLFNLMIGFGTTFLIAQIQGKSITIAIDPVTLVQFVFLALSLCATLALLLVQRFFVSRLHGLILLLIYALFLILAVLASLHKFDQLIH